MRVGNLAGMDRIGETGRSRKRRFDKDAAET